MTSRASGPFDVTMTPQPADVAAGGPDVSRMLLDKTYRGDLEATAVGQMLAVMAPVKGSAGYVAMERVSGSLHGRTGTFALQHSGIMSRATPTLSVTVVPDSGTGELTGLSGRMAIVIDGGKHSYEFDYTIAG